MRAIRASVTVVVMAVGLIVGVVAPASAATLITNAGRPGAVFVSNPPAFAYSPYFSGSTGANVTINPIKVCAAPYSSQVPWSYTQTLAITWTAWKWVGGTGQSFTPYAANQNSLNVTYPGCITFPKPSKDWFVGRGAYYTATVHIAWRNPSVSGFNLIADSTLFFNQSTDFQCRSTNCWVMPVGGSPLGFTYGVYLA